MNILHLPNNLASQMRVTVEAMRQTGLEVRGLTGASTYQNAAGLEILPRAADGASFLKRKATGLRRAAKVMEAIAWADVIHWHYGPALPGDADLTMARLTGKKRFVEFWGSDIRDPEVDFADNPWFRQVWDSGEYECRDCESHGISLRTQQRFSRQGARLLMVSPGMDAYVSREFFPAPLKTSQRVLLHEYGAAVPSAATARPLVVHAPSAPGAKGTKFVLAAVEKLRGELDFDFQLVHGMSPLEAKALMSRCDVFVDQLIIGAYGLAAIEAMALGKPVVTFLKPSILAQYPAHLPIINAAPDTIEDVLRALLRDGPRRRAAGEASRAWVEERHDARKVAAQIVSYYQEN